MYKRQRLAAAAKPKYGDDLHLIVSGDDAGCFGTTGGITVPGRFIGPASNGLAPVELFGCVAGEASGSATALSDLTDVDLTTAATEGQVLKYNASESKWKPGNDNTAGA